MDFEFSDEQLAFQQEVERFLDENDYPDVFDLTRENMAQIVDTPKRRAFMKKVGERGWLGMTWPKEHGGRDRIDWRAAFNGIIFRLRSGCQWDRLPKEYGDDSSVHR